MCLISRGFFSDLILKGSLLPGTLHASFCAPLMNCHHSSANIDNNTKFPLLPLQDSRSSSIFSQLTHQQQQHQGPQSSSAVLDLEQSSVAPALRGSGNCEVCGRFFLRGADLRRHMIVHTDERPFPCKYCNYRARQSGALARHIRIRHFRALEHWCCILFSCNRGFSVFRALDMLAIERKFKLNYKARTIACVVMSVCPYLERTCDA